MVFNPNFNNISVILWQSVLLEDIRVPEKTTVMPQVTLKLWCCIKYTSPWAGFELANGSIKLISSTEEDYNVKMKMTMHNEQMTWSSTYSRIVAYSNPLIPLEICDSIQHCKMTLIPLETCDSIQHCKMTLIPLEICDSTVKWL